jgi:hypothetical protein
MRRILVAFTFAIAAACGGSDNGGSNSNLALFQGVAWNASVTDTANCPPPIGTLSGPRGYSITFVPTTGADLQFTSAEGCVFKFNVTSSTATLANAPVSCAVTFEGVSGTITWNTFTATTTDGHNLTLNEAGAAASGPLSCPATETGTATR